MREMCFLCWRERDIRKEDGKNLKERKSKREKLIKSLCIGIPAVYMQNRMEWVFGAGVRLAILAEKTKWLSHKGCSSVRIL